MNESFSGVLFTQTMASYRTETNPAVALPSAAKQAANATRSRPVTSLDSMSADLEGNQRVHEAFQQQLAESLQVICDDIY